MKKIGFYLAFISLMLFGIQSVYAQYGTIEAKSSPKKMRIVKNPSALSFEVSLSKEVKDNTFKPGTVDNSFKILVTNSGVGVAKNVSIQVSSEDVNESIMSYKSITPIGDIEPGKMQTITVPFIVKPNIENAATGLITFSVLEKGREVDGANKSMPIKILASIKTDVTAVQEDEVELNSDVDVNIPVSPYKNDKAIALVLTISKYANKGVPTVKFAKADGKIFREYLEKTFGVNPENIYPKDENELLTTGTLKNLIKNVIKRYLRTDGTSEIIVYFAGHGAPSVTSKKAFFVPYDCDPNYVSDENAYAMDDFNNDIASLKAKSKFVIIDACFSGASGSGDLLVQGASSVLLDIDENTGTSLEDTSNVVLRSSTGKQVSSWYPEKNHSMFTYYFLKGIQGAADKNSDGLITVGELKGYINNPDDGMPGAVRRIWGREQSAVISGKDDKVLVRLK